MAYFIVGAVLFIVLGLWANRMESNRQEKLKQTAIAEGTRAGREEGTSESDCPYTDDNDEPRRGLPQGVLARTTDRLVKSQHYWWILGYRSGYEETFANPSSQAFQAGREAAQGGMPASACPWSSQSKVKEERLSAANWLSGYRKGIEVNERKAAEERRATPTSRTAAATGSASADAWFDEAIDRLVAIYSAHPNHSTHARDVKSELERIGEMFNDRGGMDLMRAAHAAFTRRCKERNLRDSSGYMSAPRSLEYHWNGIGIWQS